MQSPSWKAVTGDVFLPWMDGSAREEAACWGSGLSSLEVCKPQSCGWLIYSPKLTRRLDLITASSLFQVMFLLFRGKPCCSKVLHFCDGHNEITWLLSLACYRKGKKFSLPLCSPPPIMPVMTNWYLALSAIFSPMWLCQEPHFQLAATVVSFLPACWNPVLNCHHLIDWQAEIFHSREFPLVKIGDVHVYVRTYLHPCLIHRHNNSFVVAWQPAGGILDGRWDLSTWIWVFFQAVSP